MDKLIVEIVSRSGHVLSRSSHTFFPVTIGRGYDNDCIVDDAYISPHHLCVSPAEAGWRVTDNGSDTGYVFQKQRIRDRTRTLPSGSTITVGATILRFCDENTPVAPTRHILEESKRIGGIPLPLLAWLSLLLPTLTIGFLTFENAGSKTTFLSSLGTSLWITILPFLWSGIWSLISYTVMRKTWFSHHLLWSNTTFFLYLLFDNAVAYVEYNLPGSPVVTIVRYLVLFSLFSGLIYLSTKRATAVWKVRLLVVSTLVPAIILGTYIVVTHTVKNEYGSTSPVFSTVVKPPYALIRRPIPLDTFLNDAESLFKEK